MKTHTCKACTTTAATPDMHREEHGPPVICNTCHRQATKKLGNKLKGFNNKLAGFLQNNEPGWQDVCFLVRSLIEFVGGEEQLCQLLQDTLKFRPPNIILNQQQNAAQTILKLLLALEQEANRLTIHQKQQTPNKTKLQQAKELLAQLTPEELQQLIDNTTPVSNF